MTENYPLQERFERAVMLDRLSESGWNLAGAARLLGVSRHTLTKRIAAAGLRQTVDDHALIEWLRKRPDLLRGLHDIKAHRWGSTAPALLRALRMEREQTPPPRWPVTKAPQ